MTCPVDWTPEADSQLASLWLHHAASRKAITEAQAQIDHLLGANPLANGVAVSEGLYFVAAPPLRALYEISDDNRFVTVTAVRMPP